MTTKHNTCYRLHWLWFYSKRRGRHEEPSWAMACYGGRIFNPDRRIYKMRTIAFLSQKGGCGKTTACVNLAAALTEMDRRVLIIDLDSNACASLTFNAVAAFENSVASALLGEQPLTPLIRPTGLDGVWLAPGATNLGAVENMTVADQARVEEGGHLNDDALTLELEQLDDSLYDYVFIDCPGGSLFIERLALMACSEVIVPTGLAV